jgi:hypothetical protein
MVSFRDSGGIQHSLEVAAESLYEAAVLAVREFRACSWGVEIQPGTMTRLTVKVKAPTTVHELTLKQVENWLASSAKSPSDALLKKRLREMLA